MSDMTNRTINTILVEDDLYMQKHLADKLTAEEGFNLIAAVRDAFEAENLADEHTDLILMDVMTLHRHSGLAAGKRMKERLPQLKVVIATSLVDPEVLQQAKAGCADSLWYKDHGTAELLEVMKRTMSGEHIFPEAPPAAELKNIMSDALSPAQIEMLRRYIEGDSYREIAEQFGMTVGGVQWNFRDMAARCGYPNKEKLMAAAIENKLIVVSLEDTED